MFKEPGVRIECPRDMGNASERVGGSGRYEEDGEREGHVGRRGPGSNRLFTR